MIHRHLQGQAWSRMAIESLLERGTLSDWREFAAALRHDPALIEAALRVCEGPVDEGSAELARTLVFHLYPQRLHRVGQADPREMPANAE